MGVGPITQFVLRIRFGFLTKININIPPLISLRRIAISCIVRLLNYLCCNAMLSSQYHRVYELIHITFYHQRFDYYQLIN